MKRYITIGKKRIPYHVIQSRRKTTEILVDKSTVQILTSQNITKKNIHNTIQKHSKWIYRKQLQLRDQLSEKITFKHKSKLPYLGKWYVLQISKDKSSSFVFRNNVFYASLKRPNKTQVQQLFFEWEYKRAESLLVRKINHFSKKTKLYPTKILIKPLKTKWGGVTKRGVITLNQKLLRAPSKIIDYVIIHELCHLKVPTHKRAFWDTLSAIMPDYNRRKDWLKIHQNLLEQ